MLRHSLPLVLLVTIAEPSRYASADNPSSDTSGKSPLASDELRSKVLQAAADVQTEDAKRLRTASAHLAFERTRQDEGDRAAWIESKGTQQVLFDRGKYRFRFDFKYRIGAHNALIEDEIVYVLDDGNLVSKVTFSPRINPSWCMVERYKEIRHACAVNVHPIVDPLRIATDVVNFGILINARGEDFFSVRPHEDGKWACEYRIVNSPQNRVVCVVDPALDYRLVERHIVREPDKSPYFSHTLEWKQEGDVWYVQRYIESQNRRDKTRIEVVGVLSEFSPNVPVPAESFREESLSIPPNARVFDRRN